MENLITLKQQNYLLKLDPTLTVEKLKDFTLKQASILIAKLKKGVNKKEVKARAEKFAHGFNVGDVLYASWGYDQTNLDFFQVVAATEHSIRVKEVSMKKASEKGVSSMSRYISYDTTTATPVENSFFVDKEEQEGKGKLLRVGTYEHNGQKNYYVNIGRGRYGLYHYNGRELYESWYA